MGEKRLNGLKLHFDRRLSPKATLATDAGLLACR